MSKGNMFVTTAKGKVGNLVLYTRSGAQITRSYQSEVKNPKTTSQMLQRAKFANAVKFYKKAVQHFFKFAYEDQKRNETTFNAFMRHNISRSCYLKKDEVDSAYFPALGRWVMSEGSLAQAMIPVWNGNNVLLANTGITAELSTVGKVSEQLIAQGFNAGDIVTIVVISSIVSSVDFDLSSYQDSGNLTQPQWAIRQFIINASDTTAIADMPRRGASLGTIAAAAGGLLITPNTPTNSIFASCIVTRKGETVTYASNSELVPNAVALAMIQQSNTTSWVSAVATSWNAQGDAILHGSIAEGSTEVSEGESGTGGTSGSSTSGGTNSKISTINGGSSAVTIDSNTDTSMTIVGTNLSSVAPTVTGSGITVSDFAVNSDKTQATFKITTKMDSGTGSVAYMGQTVANINITGIF